MLPLALHDHCSCPIRPLTAQIAACARSYSPGWRLAPPVRLLPVSAQFVPSQAFAQSDEPSVTEATAFSPRRDHVSPSISRTNCSGRKSSFQSARWPKRTIGTAEATDQGPRAAMNLK